jgi:gas vesicle protein
MNPITALVMDIDAEINWERDHPITHDILNTLSKDIVRLSKNQTETIKRIVGKMEEDLKQSRTAQVRLQNHIIWHIEKNSNLAAYTK